MESAASTLMKYDKTFGEGIKIFFDTITDILLSQMQGGKLFENIYKKKSF